MQTDKDEQIEVPMVHYPFAASVGGTVSDYKVTGDKLSSLPVESGSLGYGTVTLRLVCSSMGYGTLVEELGSGGGREKRGAIERANLVVECMHEWECAGEKGHKARRKAP